MKTNELQQLAAVLGTDSLLADTEAAGTGRVSIAKLAEFLANGDNAVKAALFNKAPAGLVEGDVVHCDTNEQIVKAIETHYAEMGDYTTKLFGFNIHTHGLGLPGGAWHVTINRSSQESGSVFAYSYSTRQNKIYAKSIMYGKWTDWVPFASAVTPVWHDLQLTEDFLPDGDNAINQYCKDQFGRVTVRLQCKTAAEAGIPSEHNIAVLPAGFRPRGGQMLTCLFRDNQSSQTGYIHFYTSGTIVSGQLHNGGSLKKINCEFSFFAE